MARFWQMLLLSVKLKKFIPFKIYRPARVRITSPRTFSAASRVIIGNPDKRAAVVSRTKTNVWLGANAAVSFGEGVNFGPGVNLIIKNNAHCSIGNNTYFTSDMHIEIINRLVIGKNCAISWGVTIIDDDHHTLISESKSNEQKGEVFIGDRVWIGCNAVILKNTRLGNGCVVAAGSVVKGAFPEGSLIAGNPARVIRSNVTWQ